MITIWHIEKHYDTDDSVYYAYYPYSFAAILSLYFQVEHVDEYGKSHKPYIKGFIRFMKQSSFSENRIKKKLLKLQDEGCCVWDFKKID